MCTALSVRQSSQVPKDFHLHRLGVPATTGAWVLPKHPRGAQGLLEQGQLRGMKLALEMPLGRMLTGSGHQVLQVNLWVS